MALVDAQGNAVLRYSQLIAYDAKGKVLPAEMLVGEHEVVLQVAEAGASYPLVIDPYVQSAKLTASGWCGQ